MSPRKQAFEAAPRDYPPCIGCEKCRTTDGEILYTFAMGAWMCRKCFFTSRSGENWPRPGKERPSLMNYQLTEDDMEKAKQFAEIKNKKYKDKDWTRDWGSNHNLIGAMGEVAFWRKTGLKPRERAHGDGGFDFMKKGASIQLKTRSGAGARFMIPTEDWKKGIRASIVIHARVIGNEEVEFVGWVKRSKLKECVPLHEGVRVPTMTLPDSEWNPDFSGFMDE